MLYKAIATYFYVLLNITFRALLYCEEEDSCRAPSSHIVYSICWQVMFASCINKFWKSRRKYILLFSKSSVVFSIILYHLSDWRDVQNQTLVGESPSTIFFIAVKRTILCKMWQRGSRAPQKAHMASDNPSQGLYSQKLCCQNTPIWKASCTCISFYGHLHEPSWQSAEPWTRRTDPKGT